MGCSPLSLPLPVSFPWNWPISFYLVSLSSAPYISMTLKFGPYNTRLTIFSVLGLFMVAFHRDTTQTGLNTQRCTGAVCVNLQYISRIVSILHCGCTEELK